MKKKYLVALLSFFTLIPLVGCNKAPNCEHDYKLVSAGLEGHREKCQLCGDEKEITKHNYRQTVIKEATSLENGIIEYKCPKCGFTYQGEIEPTEQQLMNWKADEHEEFLSTAIEVSATKASEIIEDYKKFNNEAKTHLPSINKAKAVLKTDACKTVDNLFNQLKEVKDSKAAIDACKAEYLKVPDQDKILIESEDAILKIEELYNKYVSIDVTDRKTQQQMIVNTAVMYWYQDIQLQYDQSTSRKNNVVSPEECNPYSYSYLDCSSFTDQVYYEVYGHPYINQSQPHYVNTKLIDEFCTAHKGEDYVVFKETTDTWDWYKNLTEEDLKNPIITDAMAAEVEALLEPGDVYVYRHNPIDENDKVGGHSMLYLGELGSLLLPEYGEGNYFAHSTGTENPKVDTENLWNNNWDEAQTPQEAESGTVDIDTSNIVFKQENGWDSLGTYKDRYMFNEFFFSWNWMRPIDYMKANGWAPREKTKNRLLFPFINSEKTCDIGNYHSINKGGEITYKVSVKNESKTEIEPYAFVNETIPANTEFVRCSEGGTFENGQVSFRLSNLLPQQERIVTYTVKATGQVGSEIRDHETYVNGLKLGRMYHEIRADVDYEALEQAFRGKIGATYNYVATMANDVYKDVTGVDLKANGVLGYKDGSTYKLGDNTLITYGISSNWKNSKALFAKLMPNILFGGYSVRANHKANDEDIRNLDPKYLECGDLISCRDINDKVNTVYIYVAEDLLLGVENKTIVEAYNTVEDVKGKIHSMPFEKYFVVVRPSLCDKLV